MSPYVLIIGRGSMADGDAAGLSADGIASEIRRRGGRVDVRTVSSGPIGLLRAILGAHRALRGSPDVILTLSDPPGAHLVGRGLGRRRPRWIAVVDAPLVLRPGRWHRLLDPRARALRAADAVGARGRAADELHNAGVVVDERLADGAALVATVLTRPTTPSGKRGKILMLGTVNTPHVEHMAMAMAERGHEVVVAGDVAAVYPPSTLPAAGIRVRPIEIPAMAWVRRVWREERPDVVHANWLPAYGFLAAITRLHPLVVMAWGSDVYRATPFQRRQSRFAVHRADMAMSDSADLVDRLVGLGADPSTTHQLNWGVDLNRFTPPDDRLRARRELGLSEGPLVLSPRALTPIYNPETIVEAFDRVRSKFPEAQLVLKHIGSAAPAIERQLSAGVQIIGHVPYEQLAAYYRAADICVSIPDSDSSPRSVWEAMACGCACVLSDLPWVRELIEPGRHALVVPPEPGAVAGALRELLADPEHAREIGLQARGLVEERRDQRVEMDRLSALYESLR